MFTEPPDFVGNILAKLLNKQIQENEDFKDINSWDSSVVLDTGLYPITLYFNSQPRIQCGAAEEPTLTVEVSFDDIINIVKGKVSPLRAFLKRDIKVKGLVRHPIATYRFYRLISAALKG